MTAVAALAAKREVADDGHQIENSERGVAIRACRSSPKNTLLFFVEAVHYHAREAAHGGSEQKEKEENDGRNHRTYCSEREGIEFFCGTEIGESGVEVPASALYRIFAVSPIEESPDCPANSIAF